MHAFVFYLSLVWLVGLLAVTVVLTVTRADSPSAILAVDTSSLVLIAILLLVTIWTGRPYATDVALMVGLLSFIQTIAAARFLARRGSVFGR
ncbi:MAG: monovalent cation/H+ antiporter complex subunit F [Vicinamibacterales bacterium]